MKNQALYSKYLSFSFFSSIFQKSHKFTLIGLHYLTLFSLYRKMKLNVSAPTPPGQAAPLSPGSLAPAKPGTKLANIVDITLSPTFQMIQEEEKRSCSPQPPQEVRTPTMMRKVYQGGPRPFGFEQHPLGNREVIHQSGTFKHLMSQLSANPEQQA